jgi:hypothetical protein
MDQFASIRAGDWYCKGCPDNGRGRSGFRYFWDSEVHQKEEEKMVTSFNAEFFVKNALQDTDGLSKYVTKVIEQFGKHTKKELISVRDELKVVKASSASEAGAVAIMLEVINQLGVVESVEGQ